MDSDEKKDQIQVIETALVSVEEDDSRLHQLGIKRELRKEFTNFTTLSFAIGVLGYARDHCWFYLPSAYPLKSIAATIASTFNTPIVLGGPATAVWTWFIGSFGCLAIAASVAGSH